MVDHRSRSVKVVPLLLLELIAPLSAQAVHGRVQDQRTHTALASVTVELVNSSQTVVLRTETAANGEYHLAASGLGPYRLSFRSPGYRPLVKDLTAFAGDSAVEYSPELQPITPLFLDPVVVNGQSVPGYLADFYRRKLTGGGHFLTREDIDRWRPSEPSRLFAFLPGFNVVGDERPVIVSRRQSVSEPPGRTCPPLVFVDGVQMGNTETWDVDHLAVADIEAVEAYSSGAVIPPQFNATGSKCGVIVIWRRIK